MVNRKTTSKTFWRCSDRKCSGRVTTEGTTVKITAEHCHPANEAKLDAEKIPSRLFIANFMVSKNFRLSMKIAALT